MLKTALIGLYFLAWLATPSLAAQPGLCPSGASPSVESQVRKGLSLIVCGTETEPTDQPEKQISEFQIFSVRNGTLSKPLLERGALSDYQIRSIRGGLGLKEQLNLNQLTLELFASKITCPGGRCRQSPEKCIYKKLKPSSSAAMKDLQPYQKGDRKKIVPDEALIVAAARQALSGDRVALLFFTKPASVSLDGASAEEYFKYSKIIRRLKKFHCI